MSPPLGLLDTVKVARVFGLPVRFVMGDEMFDHWRTRVKRLERAKIGAAGRG